MNRRVNVGAAVPEGGFRDRRGIEGLYQRDAALSLSV